MNMQPLPDVKAKLLIGHILYDKNYDGVSGKYGWSSLTNNLITERELRNLVVAHCATKISSFNNLYEPGYDTYLTKELCVGFEMALFGREAKLLEFDVLDPWES